MSYSTILYCCIAFVLQASYALESPTSTSISRTRSLAEVRQGAELAAKAGCYEEAYETLEAYLNSTENEISSSVSILPQAFYGIISLTLLLFWRKRKDEMMTLRNSTSIPPDNNCASALANASGQEAKPLEKDPGLSPGSPFLRQAKRIILEHLEEESFGIAELSAALCLSRSQLHRKIKAETALSPSIFMRKIRLAKAKELLIVKAGNISEIAFMIGMPNLAHFSRSFKAEFGHPPSQVLLKGVNSRQGSE